MDCQISLFREGAIAVRVRAEVGLAVGEGLAAVVDLDVLFEVAGGGAGLVAGGTDGRVCGADVLLQEGVGGETECLSLSRYVIGRLVRRGRRGVGHAFRTPEAGVAVDPALVGAQLAGRFEAMRAGLPRRSVQLRARVRLLLQVHRRHVFLQRRVFPERLVARRVLGAAILLPPLVRGMMSTEPSRRQEFLAACLPIADVVAYVRVGAFDVVRKVGFASECLVAACVLAVEGPLVGVRAKVLGQTGGSVEGFGTVGVGAVVGFEVGGIFWGRGRGQGCEGRWALRSRRFGVGVVRAFCVGCCVIVSIIGQG